jgi:general secretion pathway protein L
MIGLQWRAAVVRCADTRQEFGMVRLFLEWWSRQLWELLPASWRRSRPAHETGDAVMLVMNESRPGHKPGLDVSRRRRRRTVQLGRFALDDAGLAALRASLGAARRGAIRLIVPSRLLLEQQVTLPLAAERGLETALRWEMDRLTPFAAEQVFWSWHIEQRDRTRSRLQLRLRLVPKAAVGAVLEALAASGVAPTLLASAADPAVSVPLTGPRPAQRGSRALGVAAMLFAVALAAVVVTPFVRQEFESRRLDARIDKLRPDVDLAEAMRRRLTDRAASAGVMATEAARVGDTLRILAAVTDVLPDDTSLISLSLRDRTLIMTGQSAAAAKLIPALAAHPAFRDPVFAAPVTRNEVTGAEAFTIRTELRP